MNEIKMRKIKEYHKDVSSVVLKKLETSMSDWFQNIFKTIEFNTFGIKIETNRIEWMIHSLINLKQFVIPSFENIKCSLKLKVFTFPLFLSPKFLLQMKNIEVI